VLPAVDQRTGDDWVSRRVASNGVVCAAWQQVSVGKHHAGARCDVHVGGRLLQFWIGNQLCKTVARTSRGQVRKKRASIRRMTTRVSRINRTRSVNHQPNLDSPTVLTCDVALRDGAVDTHAPLGWAHGRHAGVGRCRTLRPRLPARQLTLRLRTPRPRTRSCRPAR
jgi:hypothetical protein